MNVPLDVPLFRATLVRVVTEAVDAWVRDGGGTYDELEAVVDGVVGAFPEGLADGYARAEATAREFKR
jgi:hypothetical protein